MISPTELAVGPMLGLPAIAELPHVLRVLLLPERIFQRTRGTVDGGHGTMITIRFGSRGTSPRVVLRTLKFAFERGTMNAFSDEGRR